MYKYLFFRNNILIAAEGGTQRDGFANSNVNAYAREIADETQLRCQCVCLPVIVKHPDPQTKPQPVARSS